MAIRIIEEGQTNLKSKLITYPYMVRVLDRNDLKALIQLQAQIVANMKKKELYVVIPEDELSFILEGHGETLGVFIEEKLYAACSILFKLDYENNMARELKFNSEELSKVAQFELSFVHEALRGHHLQQKLASILAFRAEKRKDTRYLFTTVSPYNYPSIETVTSLGLYIAKLCKMYKEWDRYVVYRDFLNSTKLDKANPICLPNTSFSKQQELLSAGYRGFSQFKDKEGIKIMFAKVV